MFIKYSKFSIGCRVLNSSLQFRLRCNRASELKIEPDVQESQSAVQIIQEMERDACHGKEKSALTKKEAVQVSIQDNHTREGQRLKARAV